MVSLPIMATAGSASPPRPQGRMVLHSFDYRPVTLDGGFMKKQFDRIRDYYMAIPNDSILYQFRKRAGLPERGEKLVGAAHGGASADKFGQWLSGLSRMYASTNDQKILAKVNELVDEWEKTIAPDGYFYAEENENFAPPYRYEKAVGGLLDAYLYCGNTRALPCISRITDWAIQNLDRSRKFNDFTPGPALEWYTVSESLYRTYLVTGDSKYLDFAQVWEYPEYWELYARQKNIFEKLPFDNRDPHKGPGGWYHAYSHVNTLSSAAAAYRVKGEQHYLDTILNAYEFLHDTQFFATGAYGPEERLLPNDQRVRAMSVWPNHAETQCGTWAGFKLSKYLISFTGDAKYGDWVERLIYNSIGASPPMKDGHVYYHASYSLWGYEKHNIGFPWACCAGTRPQAAADFADLIYFKDEDHLYVNLFEASTVEWDRAESLVTVVQKTTFPESPQTELLILTEKPSTFGVKIRVPGWLAGPISASVNGEKVKLKTDRNNWATLNRTWEQGDQIVVHLPMNLWLDRLDTVKKDGFPAAILYGPVVLAANSPTPGDGYKGTTNPSDKIDYDNIEEVLLPVKEKHLTYKLANDASVEFKPFYEVKDGDIYYIYFDPDIKNRYLVGHNHVMGIGPSILRSPGWEDMGLYSATNSIGATATFEFEADGIRWLGGKYNDAGRAQVNIDGKVVATVDQYGPGRDLPFLWEYRGLGSGKHTLVITVLPENSAHSQGHFVNIAGFEVIKAN